MQQVLSGVLVAELADGIPRSCCGKLFADLGADVVKVEPLSGDPLRFQGAGETSGGAFLHFNTNKRGLVLDPANDRSGLTCCVFCAGRTWSLTRGQAGWTSGERAGKSYTSRSRFCRSSP